MLALAACAAPTPQIVRPATPAPRAERPTYALGDRWIRTDGIYELIRIEDDRYVFSADNRQEVRLTRNLAVARAQRGGYWMEFDPPPRFSWPLEVGKWGAISGLWRGHWNPTGDRVRFAWRVEAYEDVEVAGLVLKAFRISLTIGPEMGMMTEGRQPKQWKLETWYSPEVRQFVKAFGADLWVLTFVAVSFDRPQELLQIALDEPRDGSRVTGESIGLTGKVTAAAGVRKVAVTLNGEEVSQPQGWQEASRREVPLEVPLKLREGRNVLLVTATDAVGKTRQEARIVFYEADTGQAAAEEWQTRTRTARDEAAQAEAERLAPGLWVDGAAKDREAEAALGRQEWARAQAGYREARDAYDRAAREARNAAKLAQQQAEARRAEAEAALARQAAEGADAAKLAPAVWARATGAREEAEAALARQDPDTARTRFRDAESGYREAEREARQAALVARQQAETWRLQAEAAEARQAAERADAASFAASAWARASNAQREAEAALARRDFDRAQSLFRTAEAAFREAEGQAGQAARLAQQQTEARRLQAGAAEARRAAEGAEAARRAASPWARGTRAQREAEAALAREDLDQAQTLFRSAATAFREAEREALQQAAAAAAERERQAARERQREAADQLAAAVAAARREAE